MTRTPNNTAVLLLVAAILGVSCASQGPGGAEPKPPHQSDPTTTRVAPTPTAQATSTSADSPGPDTATGASTSATDPPTATTGSTTVPTPSGPPTTDPPAVEPVLDDDADNDSGVDVAAFREGFDRQHPFLRLDSFCSPEQEASYDPADVDRGVNGETVTVVHMSRRLEELALVGMTVPSNDPVPVFEAFVGLLNGECGGVRGRRIDLRHVEVAALGGAGVDLDTLEAAACLEATVQVPAVIVVESGGVGDAAARCITLSNGTALVATRPHAADLLAEARGRLLSLALTAEAGMRAAVLAAEERGLLAGRSIAVVVGDLAGQPESVRTGLLASLVALGYEPDLHILGCEGTALCTVGLETAVSRMLAAGTEVVFPAVNLTSLPGLVDGMLRSGLPGPSFVQSGLNGQSSTAVARNVATHAGPDAAAYYDGALLVDWLPEPLPDPFGATADDFGRMCNSEYARAAGIPRGEEAQPGSEAYALVTEACTMMRIVARAVYYAGENPRRRDIHHALEHLEAVDLAGMLPGSSDHGKYALPDVVRDSEYRYPCPTPPPEGVPDTGCVVPVSPYRPVP